MAESLHIEVEDDVIIVTLPGTTLRVNYSKPKKSDGLVAFGIHGDKDAGVSQVGRLSRPRMADSERQGTRARVDCMRPPLNGGIGAASGMGGSASNGESRREAAPAIGP